MTLPILATLALLAAAQPAAAPDAAPGTAPPPADAARSTSEPDRTFEDPAALLAALEELDEDITTMRGTVRYTIIKTLAADLQQRSGTLYTRTVVGERGPRDEYAVTFDTLVLDQRSMDIREHYIFDGRWFVERLYPERQFNKRELVPRGDTLDPMALMSEAPYWVSLGRESERVQESYELSLEDPTRWLATNEVHAALTHLAPCVQGHHHLLMVPRKGSAAEDDWESVRIWFDPQTLLPRLYVKSDWTGDLQIVELFGTELNEPLNPALFDTRTPPPASGWRVQIAPWRGDTDSSSRETTP